MNRLFRTRVDRGGVSSTEINQDSIRKVISKNLSDRSYNAFSTLFRKKVRDFNLNQVFSEKKVYESDERPNYILFL